MQRQLPVHSIYTSDLFFLEFLAPQLHISLEIMRQECMLLGLPLSSHPKYSELIAFLRTIPLDKLLMHNGKPYNHVFLFMRNEFIPGLNYLAEGKECQPIFVEKYKDLHLIYVALRSTSEEALSWLLKYYEKNRLNYPANPILKLLLTAKLDSFIKNINEYKKKNKALPVEGNKNFRSDLLEDACLLRNFEAVKQLCNSSPGFLNQFNFEEAVEASIYSDSPDITFYLWDVLIKNGKFKQVTAHVNHFMEGQFYSFSDHNIIDKWLFRRSFVEKCISYFANHQTLANDEKAALLKQPIIFLLKVFHYSSKEEFNKIFKQTLRFLNQELDIKVIWKRYEKNIPKILVIQRGVDITEKVERNGINNILQSLKDCVLEIFREKDSNKFKEYRYFLKNLLYLDDGLPSRLFSVAQVVEGFRNKSVSQKNYLLTEYFLAEEKMKSPKYEKSYDMFYSYFILIMQPALISDINLDLESKDITDACRTYFINKIDSLYQVITSRILNEDDESKKIFQAHYVYLNDCILLGIEHDTLFDGCDMHKLNSLFRIFIAFRDRVPSVKNLPNSFLSLMLKLDFVNVAADCMDHYIKDLIDRDDDQSFYLLAFIAIRLMHRFKLLFDKNQMNSWFGLDGSSIELFKISTSILIRRDIHLELSQKNIAWLLKDLEAFPMKKIRDNPDKTYIKECILFGKVLFDWVETYLPTTQESDYLLLKTKKTLFKMIKLSLRGYSKLLSDSETHSFKDEFLNFLKQLDASIKILNTNIALKFTPSQILFDRFPTKPIEISSFMRKTNCKHVRYTQIHPFGENSSANDEYKKILAHSALNLEPDRKTALDVSDKCSCQQLRFFDNDASSYAKKHKIVGMDLNPSPLPLLLLWYNECIRKLNKMIENYNQEHGINSMRIDDQQSIFESDNDIAYEKIRELYYALRDEVEQHVFPSTDGVSQNQENIRPS